MNKDFIQKTKKRLKRLEERVFRDNKDLNTSLDKNSDEEFKGPTGGVKLLIEKSFFKEKRTLRNVIDALKEEGYHYSKQAFNQALNRLSKKSGPLVCLKNEDVNKYVNRK